MDISKLKRDAKYILDQLVVVEGIRLVTKKPCKIVIPSRYQSLDLCDVTDEVYTLGVYAIIMDDKYCLNKVVSKMTLLPYDITTEMIEDEEYIVLSFEAGSTVVKNINLLKEDTLPYYIYRLFIAMGKVPWFISYDDLLTIFDSTPKYSGIKLGSSDSILELLGATIARTETDPHKMFRSIAGRGEVNAKPHYVPLGNVQFGPDDTISKLLGSYMKDGISSALLYPTSNISTLESVLRS